MTKTNFMTDKVYTNLFGYRQKATITVADFAEITGYDGDDVAAAGKLAARVKPGLMMIGEIKDDHGVSSFRPVKFGENGCLSAEWKTDKDDNKIALVIEMVDAPNFWDEETQQGRIPVNIIRKATNNGSRKLGAFMQSAIENSIAVAPEGAFGNAESGPIMHLANMGLIEAPPVAEEPTLAVDADADADAEADAEADADAEAEATE